MQDVDRRLVFGETPEAVERIAPGFFPKHMEAEHLARYRWAASVVRERIVLDVACGTGYGSAMLLQAGARSVSSVDVSAPALEFARATYAGPRYVRADLLALPLREACVDVVVCLETIEHVHDGRRFVTALKTILRPGGVLCLSSPNAAMTVDANPYHVHEMDFAEISDLLGSAGFRIVGAWGQYWRFRSRRGIWRLKGFGRLAHYISRWPRVWRCPRWLGLRPVYWCIHAVAEGQYQS